MPATITLEAFGRLNPHAYLAEVAPKVQDFLGVFNARSELLHWSTVWSRDRGPLLWDTYEAELTAGTGSSRIGWVYVQLANLIDLDQAMPHLRDLPVLSEPPPIREGVTAGWATISEDEGRKLDQATVRIAAALPALAQCTDDALRRFGTVELSGFQVGCFQAHLDAPAGSGSRGLHHTPNWFATADPQARTNALIAYDQGFLGGHGEEELMAGLQRRRTTPFEFGPVTAVPPQHRINVSLVWPGERFPPAHSGLGMSARLPEWSASSAGWALATVIDAARDLGPGVEDFVVRITRVS